MSTTLIILGVILIPAGILSIVKKWMWIQQGVIKRPVRVKEYMSYMGTVDIICGLFWLAFGLINYTRHIKDGTVLISLLVYLLFKLYGEFRYHERHSRYT